MILAEMANNHKKQEPMSHEIKRELDLPKKASKSTTQK